MSWTQAGSFNLTVPSSLTGCLLTHSLPHGQLGCCSSRHLIHIHFFVLLLYHLQFPYHYSYVVVTILMFNGLMIFLHVDKS